MNYFQETLRINDAGSCRYEESMTPASTIWGVSDSAHRLGGELSTPSMVDVEIFLKVIEQATPRINNTQSRRLSISTIQGIDIFGLI